MRIPLRKNEKVDTGFLEFWISQKIGEKIEKQNLNFMQFIENLFSVVS